MYNSHHLCHPSSVLPTSPPSPLLLPPGHFPLEVPQFSWTQALVLSFTSYHSAWSPQIPLTFPYVDNSFPLNLYIRLTSYKDKTVVATKKVELERNKNEEENIQTGKKKKTLSRTPQPPPQAHAHYHTYTYVHEHIDSWRLLTNPSVFKRFLIERAWDFKAISPGKNSDRKDPPNVWL